MKFNLYIETPRGKIYWNAILNKWVDHKGNATPYTVVEVKGMTLPFSIKTEFVTD